MRKPRAVLATLILAVLMLALAACGGEGDTEATASADAASDASGEGSDDSDTAETSDEGASEQEPAAPAGSSAMADEVAPGATYESFDDLPGECRDLLAGFLRDIEPIVEDVDWTRASIAEMDAVFIELETATEDFDAQANASTTCAGLDVANQDFEPVIEFAKGEAPGTVPYLEFTAGLAGAFDVTEDDETVAGCDESLAKLEQLANTYATAEEAPFSELAAAQNGILSCSSEELETLSETYGQFLGF